MGWQGALVGAVARTAGRVGDAVTPDNSYLGKGAKQMYNVGQMASDPNVRWNGQVNPFNKTPAFTAVQGAYTGSPSNPGNTGGYDNSAVNNDAYSGGASSGYYVGGRNYGSADNYRNTQISETNSMLDDQDGTLRKLLGSVGTQKTQGIQKLADSYNTEKLAGENQYGQQFEDNTRQKMGALGKVDTNARTAANSLRRLLGLSGSANQSALKFAAPNAIARVASQERGDQIENFGMNERNITQAKTSFLDDLLAKKNDRESEFLKGIATQEQSINSDLQDIATKRVQNNGGDYAAVRAARSPFTATIDAKQAEIDGLFNKYNTPFNANKTLATLNQFNVDKAAINANKASGGAEYSPYAQPLRKKLQQDYAG